MISLIDTVGEALRNDTELTELIGQRVYWVGKRISAPVFPYITYFEVMNTESESSDDEEEADDIEIQVDIWSYDSTIPIAKEVQRIIRGLGFIHRALPDVYEKDTKIIHKPISFTGTFEV